MEQIAWATFGKWTKTASGYRLESDAAKEGKAERDYRDAVAKTVAAAIAKYRADVLDEKKSDTQVSSSTLTGANTPYPRQSSAPSAR
ncbi:hypothetical protein ABTU79_19880, partial [Acinetobacter baumannii]